jgi:pyruvate/2-oxoglutarate/acetoin dehydrogenase E1 component
MLSWGYGAEIAARIADELVRRTGCAGARVAAMDTFVAYQPILEDAILPQAGAGGNCQPCLHAFSCQHSRQRRQP